MQDSIVIDENGAFIPKNLFGQSDLILDELAQAGVIAQTRAKPKAKIRRVETPDRSLEMQWVAEHGKEYAGQWVALDRDRLLSHGTNAREVFAIARNSGVEAPFFAHLEAEDELPFGGW